jgi:guanylate kinase
LSEFASKWRTSSENSVNPFPIILSSPSGGGKTTIAKELLGRRTDLGYSVSCTTRKPRPGEQQGKDYYFLSRADFVEARERGEFAEWAEVHGELYGTLRSEVERLLEVGRHVVMDIDVQGARQFATAFPHTILVFVLPPSADVLLARLQARRSEDSKSMARRLRSAVTELQEVDRYHYIIVNDELSRAVGAVSSIIDAEAFRRERVLGLKRQVAELAGRLEHELQQTTQG